MTGSSLIDVPRTTWDSLEIFVVPDIVRMELATREPVVRYVRNSAVKIPIAWF
jgi:hypothetical protein